MDITTIINIITQPNIQTVSFDIFDTLLERPALQPDDIFVLLNDSVKELLHDERFDFYRARKNIEHEAVLHNARGGSPEYTLSFEQIYDFFKRKYGLSDELTLEIMALERKLEKQLLAPRAMGRKLFEAACEAGKRIICVSDMYYDEPFLSELLIHNGFTDVKNIYVSSETKKRKDSGDLFLHVLDEEKLAPDEMVHIGDHIESDCRTPLRLGIPAFHFPSSRETFFARTAADYGLWTRTSRPSERLVIGFFLNQWQASQEDSDSLFPEKRDAGYFGLGPVLFAVAQYLRTHRDIQSDYECIHFASRDGYLPMKAYEYLNERSSTGCLPARYLYCGRSLYCAANYDGNPTNYLTHRLRKMWSCADMTIGHLFDAMVSPSFLSSDDPRRERLVSSEIAEHFPTLHAILDEHQADIDRLLLEKKNKLRAYYNDALLFSHSRRALVFDCGCGGSVSSCLMNMVGGKLDKAYLCETLKNRLTDRIRRTRTHLLFGSTNDLQPAGALTLFEEVFSPMEGPCVDLVMKNDGWEPVVDDRQAPSRATVENVLALQSAAMEFVRDIKQRFGSYLDQLTIQQVAFAADPLLAALRAPTDKSIRHFETIVFPDSFYGDHRALNEKIEVTDRDHLLRSPFVDSRLTVSRPPLPPLETSPMRLALHLHLYHMDMASCFLERLVNWRIPLDLFISVGSTRDERTAHVLFAPLLEKNVGKLTLRTFPNRGRDVAPWLVGFGKELAGYDLVGHMHTKKSSHFAWGDHWRDYLYDNLLSEDAFADIHAHFQNDPRLGVIFPPVYDRLFSFWGNHRLPHLEETDRQRCQQLMRRMGMKDALSKHNLHFPVGTMLWYRPAALASLITLGLSFDDFEPEPVGITGSLAHAIERIPAQVAAHHGFSSYAYIRQPELIRRFHQQRLQSVGAMQTMTGSLPFHEKAMLSLSQIMLPLLPRGTRRYRWAQAIVKTFYSTFRRS